MSNSMDLVEETLWSYLTTGQYELVTFDVFDTLLFRSGCLTPTDVHLRVGRRLKWVIGMEPNMWARRRIEAESLARRRARRGGASEVSFDEILDALRVSFARWGTELSREAVDFIGETEVREEAELLKSTDATLRLAALSEAAGADIAYISDFYIGGGFVRKMLDRGGFPQGRGTFVSAEIGKSKEVGDIYPLVLEALGANAERWLHIGDNPQADVAMAERHGAKVIQVPNPCRDLIARLGLRHPLQADMDDRKLLADCSREERHIAEGVQSDYLRDLGRRALGPLLLGFTSWIARAAEPGSLLAFLARDGALPKVAFEIANKYWCLDLHTDYLLVSRTLVYRALASKRERLEHFEQVWGSVTVEEALTRWDLGIDVLHALGQPWDCDLTRVFHEGDPQDRQDLMALEEAVRPYAMTRAETSARLTTDYVRERLTQFANVHLIDLGWHGSLQRGIEWILGNALTDLSLSGFYLARFSPTAITLGTQVSYMGAYAGMESADLRRSPSLVETLFAAGHAGVDSLEQSEDGWSGVGHWATWEEEQFVEVIKPIQQAALEFVAEAVAGLFPDGPPTLSAEVATAPLMSLLRAPTRRQWELLGALRCDPNYGVKGQPISIHQGLWRPRCIE